MNILCRIGIHRPEWKPAMFGFGGPGSFPIHIRVCSRCHRHLYSKNFVR